MAWHSRRASALAGGSSCNHHPSGVRPASCSGARRWRCIASALPATRPTVRGYVRSGSRTGARIEVRPLLFPGYCFVWIELQWHAARWAPGTLGLIMNGAALARVPDAVIAELRGREVDSLIELPKPRGLRRGDAVRVIHGPLQGLRGLYEGMKPRERVAVLLQILGDQQRVELPADAIEPLEVVP
jgi:transcriptional antiterminator RfaH